MKRRITAAVAVLMIASLTLAAADAGELYQSFSDAVSAGDAQGAIEYYTDMEEQLQKDYQKAERRYEKAAEAGNIDKARDAWSEMRSISSRSITKEQSDALLEAILSEDSDNRAADAKWLMENSRYYHPMISYEWSSAGDNYSFKYSSSQSVTPGEEITLPDSDSVRVNTSAAGVLSGWGVTPDEVTYQPGETIEAPYTDQTLYAIWTTQVVFKDEITGFESTVDDIASGDSIAVPAVSEPDDSYVFAGWVDRSTGDYIAPDETEVTLEGNGAIYEALWKMAELSDLSAKHYSLDAIPVNTQADLSFTITNNGSEDLRNVAINCTSSDGLSILSGNGTIRGVDAGDSVTVHGIRIVGTEPRDYMLHISATDRDGDVWEADFPLTIV